MSQPTYTSIDARILRLKVLVIGAKEMPPNLAPTITQLQIEDTEYILDELHRLHLAVSDQRAELAKLIGEPPVRQSRISGDGGKNKPTRDGTTHDHADRRPAAPGKKR